MKVGINRLMVVFSIILIIADIIWALNESGSNLMFGYFVPRFLDGPYFFALIYIWLLRFPGYWIVRWIVNGFKS
jgi:hypothetical protein